jgi:hypothetical protein
MWRGRRAMGMHEHAVLQRFHRLLVREFGSRSPWDLSAPLMVSDICHSLAPFPNCRDELGVDTLSEYEHALLRLVAGEGGYVRLESEDARQAIRECLDSSRAGLGLSPEVLAAFVYLNPDVKETTPGEEKQESLPPFETCRWCGEAVPQQARVRFCPSCGHDVRLVPCPSCAEALDLDWRFCIRCGTEVGARADAPAPQGSGAGGV